MRPFSVPTSRFTPKRMQGLERLEQYANRQTGVYGNDRGCLLSPQSAAHKISELKRFLYFRISGVSLWGLMLVGLTLTTEIFLASFSLACSCLSSSLANMAVRSQKMKNRSQRFQKQIKIALWRMLSHASLTSCWVLIVVFTWGCLIHTWINEWGKGSFGPAHTKLYERRHQLKCQCQNLNKAVL